MPRVCFSEAHPTEAGDYIDYFLPINRHKNLEERLKAASNLNFCKQCKIC